MPTSSLYIGLMSGTSLDGVDAVLAEFGPDSRRFIASAFLDFPATLRLDLMTLQAPSENEIHLEALVGNVLARGYAECIRKLLESADVSPRLVRAVGVHGQTIRHRPELGFTRQVNNPALLAELCGIDVIADFRSRDIAAGGQGAPLVPAFHAAVFGAPDQVRVVVNIGGIANISILAPQNAVGVTGFDTGPGNVLMDAWIMLNRGQPFDAGGAWAAQGMIVPELLQRLRSDPFIGLPPPKSTGRDLFHMDWLNAMLAGFPTLRPVDVQATLAAFTATTIADAIVAYGSGADAVYVCGGGAWNVHLLELLQESLRGRGESAKVLTTAELGILPNHVEALAFAWLAHRFTDREAGNLPAVTGARGERILGALYPA